MNDFSSVSYHLLCVNNQLKFFHWNSTTFAAHKALGKLYDYLADWIDYVTEVYMGNKGFKVVHPKDFKHFEYENPSVLLTELVQFLLVDFPMYLDSSCLDLLNKRDELLGEIRQTQYLLTLL